jgi:uncharacterized integral membrane protein
MSEEDVSQANDVQTKTAALMEEKKKQLRDTAKWILTIFGAIATVLLAGLNFSNISQVVSPYLYWAIGSFVVALTAVFLEIYWVSQVLTCGSMNEEQLRAFARDKRVAKCINLNDVLLLDGYRTVDIFLDVYSRLGKTYETAVMNEHNDLVASMTQKMARMVNTFHNLSNMASYTAVRVTYKKAIQGIFIYGAVAALAIAVFAWSVGKTPVAVTVFANPPAAAQLTLTEAGKQALGASLGKQCVAQPTVAVILLSVEGSTFDVVSQPTAGCAVVRFKINAEVGQVSPQP